LQFFPSSRVSVTEAYLRPLYPKKRILDRKLLNI
jgi:hypothetical protein